ncbi:tRNA nucleotidyltransferase, N-terminal domain [Olavius algarvensis Delta 1 endosymbiont]|nr:tRNA nucleotidyltransferase, N-terminal domain [Olavius algarvensis Delta 1 endosymbiont]
MQIATTHVNTDFDALASVIAATLIYPGSSPVLPKNLNPNVKAFLSIHKDLLRVSTVNDLSLTDVTSLIVVDVNKWERLDGMADLKNKGDLEIHLWDHHTNEGNITANFRCQEPVGATITLLTRQLKNNRTLLTPIQATLFLAGIYEDTGNLTFSATTAEDLHAGGAIDGQA